MAIKYKVILTEEERVMLSDIVKKGKRRKIMRLHAQILLNIDQKNDGKAIDVEIAKILNTSVDTIERTRKRFVEEGLVLRLALFGIKHAVLSHDIYDFLESKSLIFFETT